ncbi:alpha/beta fold hydrolase [Microtetraspora malaysiensis]|uniref:alpha/beta fold hydrolase n=1 Tax=Microtetraspora malaysiensis TaxID=161358 RepID=UPI003D8FF7E6
MRDILPAYFADYWANEDELAPLRASLRAWVDPMRAAEPAFDVRDKLGDITTPTLIISGAHDFICGPHWGKMLHEGISHSQFVLLRDSGHMGHIEQHAAFASAIIGFSREANQAVAG